MEIIYLICKIIEFDSTLLYIFLCANKYLNNNILKNIIILNLFKNTKIQNIELNKFHNIIDDGLKYISNIHTLNLYNNTNIDKNKNNIDKNKNNIDK